MGAALEYTANASHAANWIRSIQGGAVGLDIETYSPYGFSFATDPYTSATRSVQLYDGKRALFIDVALTGMFPELRQLLENKAITKIAHNSKFEWKQIKKQYGIEIVNLYCTMVADQVLNAGIERTFNLEDMALRRLNWQLDKTLQSCNWGGPLTQDHIVYGCNDSIAAYHIYFQQVAEAQQRNLMHILQLETRVTPAIARMELDGLYYSKTELEALGLQLQKEYSEHLAKAQAQLPRVELPASFYTAKGALTKKAREAGYMDGRRAPETRDDFIKAFKLLGVEIPQVRDKETGKMKDSLSKQTWGKVQHPAGKLLQKHASVKHLYDSFVKNALDPETGWYNRITGKVHPGWNQCGTVTGRFSSSQPNFQNQPRRDGRFRKILFAPEGWVIIKADYSQIEMRVMAQVSRDKNLTQAYLQNKDVHVMTAAKIFNRRIEDYAGYETDKVLKEERQLGKNVNFGSLYGQGPRSLQDYIYKEVNIEYSFQDCQKFLEAFFAVFPGIKSYHKMMEKYIIQSVLNTKGIDPNVGNVEVCTLAGRARRWMDVQLTPRVDRYTGEVYHSVKMNEELNLPVQGTVGDAMKFVMARLEEEVFKRVTENPDIKMLLQVHDELVFMAKKEVVQGFTQYLNQVMVEEMAKFVTVVPVVVDVTVGRNWAGEPV